jgi:L-ornithine N5-monooxygenase
VTYARPPHVPLTAGPARGDVFESSRPQCRDIVGIGFGPANLSLALALLEGRETIDDVSATFFERQPAFGWHRGMLLDRRKMQISFLKDLVTQRNPQSEFSFVNYLHKQGRLLDFISLQTFCPTRHEFHDYLSWCANAVAPLVRYGYEVTRVAPVVDRSGCVTCWKVSAEQTVAGRARIVVYASAVVFSPGITPRLPDGIPTGDRIWHSADLLSRLCGLAPREGARFVVVGGGQSAAEAIAYIHERHADVEVVGVLPNYGYSPADDSPFVNGLFDPTAIDEFYEADPGLRNEIVSTHANTNYGVVDADLITELYERWYAEKVSGRRRLFFERTARLASVRASKDGLRLTLRAVGSEVPRLLDADYLVCATGYRPASLDTLMSTEMRGLVKRDVDGEIEVLRDYSVATPAHVKAAIFAQGDERTHGLGATLISNLAVRAGDIVNALNGTARSETMIRERL